MKITKLLSKLPDWPSFLVKRAIESFTRIRPELQDIISRVMGDVVDWLRLTPNAI